MSFLSHRNLTTWTLILTLACAASAQRTPKDLTDSQIAGIAQRMSDGDVNALAEAVDSGNQAFVPYYHDILRNPSQELHGQASLLQLGLAKAGEREQLQQVLCEFDYGDPPTQSSAERTLVNLGGWFAIRTLATYLGDDPDYRKPRSHDHQAYLPMQDVVLQLLPKVVPAPPTGPTPPLIDHSNAVRAWQEYLENHRAALRSLQPTGEGITSSKSICQQILRDDPVVQGARISKRKTAEK